APRVSRIIPRTSSRGDLHHLHSLAVTPRYSLVIPVYNEAGNILPLLEAAVPVLVAEGEPFEIIVVNDGSNDATADELRPASARWPNCRALNLATRGGQAAALLAGLCAAQGELLITMDGDGQN